MIVELLNEGGRLSEVVSSAHHGEAFDKFHISNDDIYTVYRLDLDTGKRVGDSIKVPGYFLKPKT